MKLVTACPACATRFFLSQEQLNANRGKVCCGRCKQVFNGNETLYKLATTPAETTAVIDVDLVNVIEATHPSSPDQNLATTEQGNEKTIDVLNELANEIKVEAPHIEDYFLGASKLKPLGTKNPQRWFLIIVIVILFLLAIGQTLYYFKNTIATQLPQAKPYLIQVCSLVSCKIELPMQLESLTIDDSEMREDAEHEHVLLFSITLTNKANIALRYPSIELTLTNVDDEAVVRRTFTPKEYIQASGNLELGISAKANLPIKLALDINNLAVTGYKLDLVQ